MLVNGWVGILLIQGRFWHNWVCSEPRRKGYGMNRQQKNSSVNQPDSHKVGAVLVVGGGIAGMQSALDLANSGFKVYLVEDSTSIGGRMSQLDKTFPTNDCSMC